MKVNSQKLKFYKNYKRLLTYIIRNYKRVLTPLTPIIILFSCHSSERVNVKPSTEAILYEQYGRELFKKYQPNNYNKWQELNKLLERNFIPPNKLNVIDCRGLNQHSEDLVKVKVLDYDILGKTYSWNEYEMEQGRCIQLNISVSNSFFLSPLEASILLSASIGYHFEELNLKLPTILYKKMILHDLNGMPCGSTSIEQRKNITIHKNGCMEETYYEYEIKKNPEKRSPIQFSF